MKKYIPKPGVPKPTPATGNSDTVKRAAPIRKHADLKYEKVGIGSPKTPPAKKRPLPLLKNPGRPAKPEKRPLPKPVPGKPGRKERQLPRRVTPGTITKSGDMGSRSRNQRKPKLRGGR